MACILLIGAIAAASLLVVAAGYAEGGLKGRVAFRITLLQGYCQISDFGLNFFIFLSDFPVFWLELIIVWFFLDSYIFTFFCLSGNPGQIFYATHVMKIVIDEIPIVFDEANTFVFPFFSNYDCRSCFQNYSITIQGSPCLNHRNLRFISFKPKHKESNNPQGYQIILQIQFAFCYVVAVSDTYRDEISDGYFIRDRIYYSRHHIPGWHPYPGMAHLPGNFNSRTLTQPNEAAFMHTTREFPVCTALSVDHTCNSWAYSRNRATIACTLYFVLRHCPDMV